MMESESNTVREWGKSFRHLLEASASEREEMEGGHRSVVFTSMAKPVFGVVISSVLSNAATTIPHAQGPSISPVTKSWSCEGNDGLGVFPNQELRSDGVTCHNLKHCHSHSDTFEVELSETCQRRFVMFDHSGSKKRIIFHPSLANEYPTLLQLHHNASSILGPIQDTNARAVGYLKQTFITPPPSADYYTAFDAMEPSGWRSVISTNGKEDQLHASGTMYVEEHSQGRIPDCLSRENSQDLEALLWSDDEETSSTGHSLSVLTMSDIHNHCSIASGSSNSSTCVNRKRKACKEADTESTATSGKPTSKKIVCSNSDLLSRGSGYSKEGHTVFDLSSGDEGASSSSSSNYQSQHELHYFALEQAVKRQMRKEKLQNTLDLLRSIIPGGESMSTSLVLDGAVQIVKNLQMEVRQLEAAKNSA